MANQKPPNKQSSGLDSLTGDFSQTFKELIMILLKLFKKIEGRKTHPNSLYEVSTTLIPKPLKDSMRKENYRQITLINIDVKIFRILAK